ncbi:MAG: DUF2752 domain-containing protein, partial [Clostridia bacterium]|nr:DUF2752 domain-containing protein [Clostridia bacterium]
TTDRTDRRLPHRPSRGKQAPCSFRSVRDWFCMNCRGTRSFHNLLSFQE